MRVQGKEETGAGDKSLFLTAYQNSTKCFYVLLSHTVLEALMKMTIMGFLLRGGGGWREIYPESQGFLSLELLFQLDLYSFLDLQYFHTLIAFCATFMHAPPSPRVDL